MSNKKIYVLLMTMAAILIVTGFGIFTSQSAVNKIRNNTYPPLTYRPNIPEQPQTTNMQLTQKQTNDPNNNQLLIKFAIPEQTGQFLLSVSKLINHINFNEATNFFIVLIVLVITYMLFLFFTPFFLLDYIKSVTLLKKEITKQGDNYIASNKELISTLANNVNQMNEIVSKMDSITKDFSETLKNTTSDIVFLSDQITFKDRLIVDLRRQVKQMRDAQRNYPYERQYMQNSQDKIYTIEKEEDQKGPATKIIDTENNKIKIEGITGDGHED